MQDPIPLPDDITFKPLGEVVRARREDLGLTQQELADSLELSAAFVSLLESGKKYLPDQEHLDRLCDALLIRYVRDLDLIAYKHQVESSAATTGRLRRLGDEGTLLPGVPVTALRELLESDTTARTAVVAWLQRMRVSAKRQEAAADAPATQKTGKGRKTR